MGLKNLLAKTWEETNSSLVYALKMEKVMMIFLFSSLSLLVSQVISGGFLLLFNKLKFDLASLWILGLSARSLFYNSLLNFITLTFVFCFSGVVVGYFFSKVLASFGENLMPSVFLEQSIPVHITNSSYLISFLIPFSISSVNLFIALKKVYLGQDHLKVIRTIS